MYKAEGMSPASQMEENELTNFATGGGGEAGSFMMFVWELRVSMKSNSQSLI